MSTIQHRWHVPDIECGACADAIKRSLSELSGIKLISVQVEAKMVEVEYDPQFIKPDAIFDRIEEAGFSPEA